MQRTREVWSFFLIYSLFIVIAAILILGEMIASPSEPGNSLFLGLSLPRLVLALVLLIAILLFTYLASKSIHDHDWAERISGRLFGGSRLGRTILWFTGISFGLGWIGCFLPFYRA